MFADGPHYEGYLVKIWEIGSKNISNQVINMA